MMIEKENDSEINLNCSKSSRINSSIDDTEAKMYEKQLNKTSGFNVLFMTSAITETISQFNTLLLAR